MVDNISSNCPAYETKSFILRPVKIEDAKELLLCYSDKNAVSKMNTDFCTSDFYYATLEEMVNCIKFWSDEQEKQRYVRLSIVSKENKKAIGTIEISGGDTEILRIDIASAYESNDYIEEIIKLSVFRLIGDFNIKSLKIKTSNIVDRIPIFEKYGFILSETFRPEFGYHERPVIKVFDKTKGLAYCGLACCVCSENKNCFGCRNDGCKDKDWCKSFKCCKNQKLSGCWNCTDFPCDYNMLNKPRVKAFSDFISQFGEEKLINALNLNEQKGILYHYKNQLTGDYDLLNESEIFNILNYS